MRLFLSSLVALTLGLAAPAAAQTPTGDGLRGDYYEGQDFEHYVTSRYDAAIDFNWHAAQPVRGVPEDYFSVRWTGWLVPPVSGEYVLQVLADDGVRLWLNNRQLLNEWRGQEATLFPVKVQLKAGQPYRLRLDYNQYRWETRLLLSWLPPTATPARNPLGLPNGGEPTLPIPARYLFSHFPAPPKPVVVPAPVVAAPPRPMPRVALPPVAVRGRVATPSPRPARVAAPRPTRPAPTASQVTALGNRLASGQALTMRALYFEQGKAFLLPPVQASLDTLAAALRQRPALRLQVQGHTDNQGDSVLNRQLSQRRAEAVCQYLAAHGVAAGRLRALGLGGRHPVANNNVPAERARNRRVVLLAE